MYLWFFIWHVAYAHDFYFYHTFFSEKCDFIAKILIYVGLRIRFYLFSTYNQKIWCFFRKTSSFSLALKKNQQFLLEIRKINNSYLNLKRSSKTHQSSLTVKGGSTSHLGLLPSGEKRKPLLLVALNRFAIWMADHQRFFLKSTRPSLPLKKAPPLFPSPFPLRVQGMYQPPYSVLKPLRYMVGGPSEVFSKTYPSFLTLKEGSTAFSKPFSPQGTRDVPTALLGAQTASLYGWRTIRGLRQQQSCGFLCGDEPALLKSCLWNRRDIRIDA